jgi:nicotinate-nucleotide pyrophosphorylase (carboxylating)
MHHDNCDAGRRVVDSRDRMKFAASSDCLNDAITMMVGEHEDEQQRNDGELNMADEDDHIQSSSFLDFSTSLEDRQVDEMVAGWIRDDMPSALDVGGFVVGSEPKEAVLYMKSSGVFAGKPFFDAVFRLLGCTVEWSQLAEEGNRFFVQDQVADACWSCLAANGMRFDVPPVKSSSNKNNNKKVLELARIRGPVHQILRGERTALNCLSRCSGVATTSRRAVDAARELGWNGHVAGTRKTTPGFRLVEKYGLLVGGAATHRIDLSQMVMLKDNHVWAMGSIREAVRKARIAAGFSQRIEVECRTLEEAMEAARAGADIVMLDNYRPIELKSDAQALKSQFPHVLIEASGGITLASMKEYLSEHVDIVSQGSLTQGYSCVDFSLKIVH